MNIKESVISSFFFHLILLSLMVVAASQTTGFYGGLQNIVSVDLTMEEKDQPDSRANSAEGPPLTSSPLPSEEANSSDQTVNSLPEESNETPEPEKKVEPFADPAKIENAEKPLSQTKGFNMVAYYQFIMMHKKIFGQKAGAKVNELLGEAFMVNERQFYGGTAMVNLKFSPDGNLSEVLVDSVSPELKAFLEEIDWVAMPAPAVSLGFTGVQIEFTVLEGSMSFKIDSL